MEVDARSGHQNHDAALTEKSPGLGYGADDDLGVRKQRIRRSGGFLLQDTPSAHPYESQKRLQPPASKGVKGKERAYPGDTVDPKHGSAKRNMQKPFIRSSPLSTVVYNASDRSETHSADQTLINRTHSSLQNQVAVDGLSSNTHYAEDEGRSYEGQPLSAFGHNTDPAQIVNLALNLSERRRRNISAGRLSPAYVDGTRRQVSSETNSPRSPNRHISVAGANLRRHLNDQRRISRTSTPRSSIQSWESPSPRSAKSSDRGDISASSGLYEPELAQSDILKPSEATLARVEKARVAFELSFEHRRLLQYLPKLPISAKNKPPSSKPNKPDNVTLQYLGRAYNPLQYIRNRRVRGRERIRLDAEAEGWKDPDRVKLWVDRVADEYTPDARSADDKHVLPPLYSMKVDPHFTQGSPTSPISISTGAYSTRSERQSSGWAFTPWDLLADAYWLSRDDNMRLIEDANGKKFVPLPQLPKQSTPRTSLEQARPPGKRSLSLSRSVAAEEQPPSDPSFKKKHRRNLSHLRGKSYEARSPLRGYESPQERKGRWRKNFIRSRSPSSSEGSLFDGANGYAWGSHHDREVLDSVALEKQMMELLAKEIDDDPFARPTETETVKEGSTEANRDINEQDGKLLSNLNQSENQARTPNRGAQNPLPTLVGRPGNQRGRRPRLSFDDLDNSTPNSPSNFHFGPSILINRSAPNSRSVSPKKPLPSRLGRPLFRNRSNSRRSVSNNDFAFPNGSPVRSAQQRDTDASPKAKVPGIEKFDSSNNLLSPITAERFGKRFHRLNNSLGSIKAVRESKDPESRFRGFLKGGRIAELVGNEVSRVGDMIWRRDGSNLSQTNSPISLKDSDTEGEYSAWEYSPETDLSRVTTNNEDGGNLSRKSTRSGQPRYHHPNLPTFRSSISQASPGSTKAPSPEDHPITRQQMAQKARGRSSKFDRLAPPRIDMRNVSPSVSPHRSPTQTSDNNDTSRDPSSSRSTHRVRSADRRLNDVLGIPGTVRNTVAPTGLANLSSKTTKHRNSTRPTVGDREWSISDRSVSNTRSDGTVTKRDIARVRALLLSSGIKANEIARQAYSIDDPPFLPQLRELHERSVKPIPRVPRAQEHLLTAKLIVAEIDSTNQRLRDQAEYFSNETVESLHQRLKELDERVSGTLVPQVRASADDADALSMELTTTHTLSVKRLGDSVEALLRRRRRRGRWIRRGGYVLLEWVLLGVMWCVWLLVVLVRLARGVVRGVTVALRWMVWL